MLPHPSTIFKIQKYYQNESKRNDFYSRNDLPKIKDGTYVIKTLMIMKEQELFGAFIIFK